MKNLLFIICLAIAIAGCGKEKAAQADTAEKVTYVIYASAGVSSSLDVQPKFKVSGTDIETRSYATGLGQFIEVALPNGKTTTITATITEGTNRSIYLTIYKKLPDNTIGDKNKIFDDTALESISATFKVE